MFKIVKADDPVSIERVWILIYGEPGIGKTTTAFSCNNPILLNFNKTGVNRAKNRKDHITITSWSELEKNKKDLIEAIKGYDTIIFDTIEDMLNLLGTNLKESDYKLRKGGFAFWAALRDGFKDFMNLIDANNKDMFFITHIKEKDEGEVRIKRPLISGQAYDFMIGLSDFIGYMHAQGKKRVLDFNVADTHYGKNPANFSPLEIPHFETDPEWMKSIIEEMKSALSSSNEASKHAIDAFKSAKKELSAMNGVSVEEINNYLEKYSEKLGKAQKKEIFESVTEKCKKLGYVWDKDQKGFYDPKPKPEPTKKETAKKEEVVEEVEETAEAAFFDEDDF
jgi:hypothetical protein